MEMEPTPPVIAKKLWNTLRILFLMMRKGMSKSKLIMFDLHVLLKRGKVAGKALTDLMVNHQHNYAAALSCRSDASLSFVSPREYEFSCSNTPLYSTRRKHHHHHYHYNHHHKHYYNNRRDEDISVIHKVFDILNNEEAAVAASPLFLPGFGKSPMVRQLRITDSPFPLKEAEDHDPLVDKAAEEFINKFYKKLKQEKKMAALQSPSPYHIWAS